MLYMLLAKHSYRQKLMKEYEELFRTKSGLQSKYLKMARESFINVKEKSGGLDQGQLYFKMER